MGFFSVCAPQLSGRILFATPRRTPGREKMGKIYKISDEKLIFSPQISYIILRRNVVNAVKLCKFTARVSGELTKRHHISPLSTSYRPCNEIQTSHLPISATSSSTAPILTKIVDICFEFK